MGSFRRCSPLRPSWAAEDAGDRARSRSSWWPSCMSCTATGTWRPFGQRGSRPDDWVRHRRQPAAAWHPGWRPCSGTPRSAELRSRLLRRSAAATTSTAPFRPARRRPPSAAGQQSGRSARQVAADCRVATAGPRPPAREVSEYMAFVSCLGYASGSVPRGVAGSTEPLPVGGQPLPRLGRPLTRRCKGARARIVQIVVPGSGRPARPGCVSSEQSCRLPSTGRSLRIVSRMPFPRPC